MMSASIPGSARIFISYRRDDAAYPAGWLFDRLVNHFGDGQVFRDVDTIQLGDDFVADIAAAVGSCAVLLAVIGDRWLTVTGEEGGRRLDDPADLVRLELEAALTRDIRVIPVLVDRARMPRAAELPASLEKLASRQAHELSPNRFNSDAERLLSVLDGILSGVMDRPSGPSAAPGRPLARGGDHPAARAATLPGDIAGPGQWAQTRSPSRLVRKLTGHTGLGTLTGGINGVVFSPDGTLLASAGGDKTVRVWETATGAPVRTLTGHTGWVSAVAFSPDGAVLASAGDDKTVRVWETATGAPVRTLTGHTGWVSAVAFSPDGAVLASAGVDKTVRVWETATGAAVRTLTGHTGSVSAVAFSPDGALLASAGADETVRVWEATRAGPVRTLTGHASWVRAVAFSPDGALFASAGDDKTVQVWETATGAPVRTLTGHTGRVWAVAFSPDGALLASAGRGRKVLVWG